MVGGRPFNSALDDNRMDRQVSLLAKLTERANLVISVLFGSIAIALAFAYASTRRGGSIAEGEGAALMSICALLLAGLAIYFAIGFAAFKFGWRIKWLLQAIPLVAGVALCVYLRMSGIAV